MPGRVNRASKTFIARKGDASKALKEVSRNLSAAFDSIEGVTEEAIREAAEQIFHRSQVLVPVDTGALKQSGFIDVHSKPGSVEAVIGYGEGGEPPYAILVHEILDKHHDAPTGAKFLEQAGNEMARDIQGIVAKHIKKVLG